MTHLERAIADGNLTIDDEADTLTYVAAKKTVKRSNPEERVRAEFWAELVYVYGYSPHRIGVEVVVPDRVPSDRADLVIFADDKLVRPYAVIECKRDGISDAEFLQAVEQAVGNGTWAKLRASYAMVVAGASRRVLDFSQHFGILEREDNILADLPHSYGKPQEFKYRKGTATDITSVTRDQLIAALRKCHQSLWGGGQLSPPAAFGELSKIIFIKTSDELYPRKEGDPYQFQIKTHETTQALSSRVHELYDEQRRRDPEVFSEPIRVDDDVLRTIVTHLEGINLSATDVDVKGVAFETFMDNFFKGDYGQFFTPREVVSFAVDMLGVSRDDKVIDPSCGSAGFLLQALSTIRTQADEYYDRASIENYKYWHDFATKKLFGLEINEEIARIAKMNMILHGDGHTNIVRVDALQDLDAIEQRNADVSAGTFDLVLTNPPFGAQISAKEKSYLKDYELALQPRTSRTRPSQKSEVLFIERIYSLLRSGTGRAAIVLPDGLLTNSSLQYVRDFMLDRFAVLAVVSLPQTTFSHYGTGVKSSLVLLRKRAAGEIPTTDEKTFMAVADTVGYDSVGRPTSDDLPQILSEWRQFQIGATS